MTTSTVTTEYQRQEWLRLPQSGKRCPVSGLSRATLNLLILPNAKNGHRPPVRSVVLKQRWAIRGIRLVSRSSLIDYINSLDRNRVENAAEGNASAEVSHE